MTTLNTDIIRQAMEDKGLNASGLAKAMEVSRESVSKWLNGEAVPRADKLLRMCLLLGVKRASVLGLPDRSAHQPQVAFRMARGKDAQDQHVQRARHMGKMLEALVPHLPFTRLQGPPALKNPTSDYAYLQELSQELRQELGVTQTGAINIQTLSKLFLKLQAVIVPVLWGHRKNHENAIHVYLPKTATTWVYLNLDTRLVDLKFWLAHELGHTYTFSTLQGDAGEDFADGFAGALLFPQQCAQAFYDELQGLRSIHARIKRVQQVAAAHEISMICVGKQLDRYADHMGLERLIDDHKALYQVLEMSKPALASKVLLGDGDVELPTLIKVSESVFHTPVFSALATYARQHHVSPGYVQGILDCSPVDAREIVSGLA